MTLKIIVLTTSDTKDSGDCMQKDTMNPVSEIRSLHTIPSTGMKLKKKKRVDLPYCISGKQFQLGNTWKSLIKYSVKELKFYIYSYSYCSILNLEDKECFSFFSKLFLTSWIFPSLHLSLSRHHSIKVNFKIF